MSSAIGSARNAVASGDGGGASSMVSPASTSVRVTSRTSSSGTCSLGPWASRTSPGPNWRVGTPAAEYSTNTIFTYYHYYHDLWKKRFPNLTIKEIDVSSYPDLTTKVILGVNAGNPPDLIGTQGQLGALVARKAVQNLDAYYKLYNITPGMFLPALASWARMQGHWYAMPENSNPSQGELLTIPRLV